MARLLARVMGVVVIFASVLPAIFFLETGNVGELELFLVIFLIGLFLFLIGSEKEPEFLSNRDVVFVISVFWFILPIIFSIPYLLFKLSPLDAIFESFSALTTTGFSFYTAQELETLPLSLRFWRSFEQWLGGIGIVILTVFVLKKSNILFRNLSLEGRAEFLAETLRESAIKLLKLYVWITFVTMALLSFAGQHFINALNIALTAVATGGMVPGLVEGNLATKVALTIGILLGSINFKIIYQALQGKVPKEREGLLAYLALPLLSVLFYFLFHNFSLADYIFHAYSAISCAGFSFIDLTKASVPYLFFLIILMLTGGMLFSTAGAIKIDRVIIAMKALKREIKRLIISQKEIEVIRYNGQPVSERVIYSIFVFIFLYLFVFFLSSFLFSFYTKNLLGAMFEVASALGNVGLSLGYISLTMPASYKIMFIFLMYLGRLEIILPLALIVEAIYYLKNKLAFGRLYSRL